MLPEHAEASQGIISASALAPQLEVVRRGRRVGVAGWIRGPDAEHVQIRLALRLDLLHLGGGAGLIWPAVEAALEARPGLRGDELEAERRAFLPRLHLLLGLAGNRRLRAFRVGTRPLRASGRGALVLRLVPEPVAIGVRLNVGVEENLL